MKIVMYLLNRVPSKTVPKTPFELWTNRTPSFIDLGETGVIFLVMDDAFELNYCVYSTPMRYIG